MVGILQDERHNLSALVSLSPYTVVTINNNKTEFKRKQSMSVKIARVQMYGHFQVAVCVYGKAIHFVC